ncbi:MAG TPA: dihydrodipicolinate synthase family protein [Mycobacteriales bacterium]|nr:dihydrodipicolinate synthase family protein [Mycobacteriales bacterium]
MTAVLSGVIPPVVTPRRPDGDLDRASLARLCRGMVDAGVGGLFIGGSTGEAALLDDATRLAALDVAVEAAAGRVPVLFGVIDTGTRRVIERARPARDHGAAALVATAPFYVSPDQREILAHFAELHRRLDLPIVAYDIPPATHVRIEPDTMIALARSGDIAAAKDSSGDLAGLRWTLDHTRELGFPVFTGSETLVDSAVAAGAAGVVPGLGNVDPAGFVRLYEAARAGDTRRAADRQRRLSRLFRIIAIPDRGRIGFTAGALGAFKAAMVHLGQIDHPDTWPPLGPLTAAEAAAVARIVDAEMGRPDG